MMRSFGQPIATIILKFKEDWGLEVKIGAFPKYQVCQKAINVKL